MRDSKNHKTEDRTHKGQGQNQAGMVTGTEPMVQGQTVPERQVLEGHFKGKRRQLAQELGHSHPEGAAVLQRPSPS